MKTGILLILDGLAEDLDRAQFRLVQSGGLALDEFIMARNDALVRAAGRIDDLYDPPIADTADQFDRADETEQDRRERIADEKGDHDMDLARAEGGA